MRKDTAMKEITVTMTRAAFETYKSGWSGRDGKFSKEALVKYVNQTGGYIGRVVDITIED